MKGAHNGKNNTGTTVCGSKSQSDRQDALGETTGISQLHSPVRARVSVWRRISNWDAENIETKAIIDGLVACGVLCGDRVKDLPAIEKIGYVCTDKEEERTVIEVSEA